MKLYIKNKLVSLRGSSSVKDEAGNDVLVVKGALFSITNKKLVRDTDGNLLYKVRNKWFNFITRNAYVYDGEGTKIAKIKRKFGIKNSFIVEGYQDEIAIEGDFFSWTLDVFRNGEQIGTIRREFDWTDAFVLEANVEDDGAFLVALVIAIDNIFDKMSNSSR